MDVLDFDAARKVAGSLPPPSNTRPPRSLSVDRWIRADPTRVSALRTLSQPRVLVASAQVIASWALILAAWVLVVRFSSWGALLVAVGVVGTRQRALLNSLHDASHVHSLGSRDVSRRLAAIFLAAPLFEDYREYRKDHLRHHVHLGMQQDPDFVAIPDHVVEAGSARVFLHVLLDGAMWMRSVLGLATTGRLIALRGVAFLVSTAALLALVTWSPLAGLQFLGLWFVAKATSFHAIRSFAEISDHVGLAQGGDALSATRNLPRNFLSTILHPHGDNYHLAHHLFPGVPLANLERLHEMLLAFAPYAQATHCDGYFYGSVPVVADWTQRATEAESPVSERPSSR